VAGANDALLRLLEEALKVIPGPSLPDLFLSSWLAMLVSRIPGKIELRCSAMIAILNDIVQEHQDRRSAEGVDEDEDLLDVLLRLQKDMDSLDPHHRRHQSRHLCKYSYPRTLTESSQIAFLPRSKAFAFAGSVQCGQRDVGNDTAVGDGRDDAEPVGFVKAQDEVQRALASHDAVSINHVIYVHGMCVRLSRRWRACSSSRWSLLARLSPLCVSMTSRTFCDEALSAQVKIRGGNIGNNYDLI
jgi:hypothetical protein